MASPLFCEGLVENLRLQSFLGIHLLKPGVLDLQLLEPGHHRRVHPAVLGSPLVKGRRTHPKLPADLWHRQSRLNPLQSL